MNSTVPLFEYQVSRIDSFSTHGTRLSRKLIFLLPTEILASTRTGPNKSVQSFV